MFEWFKRLLRKKDAYVATFGNFAITKPAPDVDRRGTAFTAAVFDQLVKEGTPTAAQINAAHKLDTRLAEAREHLETVTSEIADMLAQSAEAAALKLSHAWLIAELVVDRKTGRRHFRDFRDVMTSDGTLLKSALPTIQKLLAA